MNQEECLQIVRASTRARKYVVVQQNTISAYVVAYLVDLEVAPSSSCPVPLLLKCQTVVSLLEV